MLRIILVSLLLAISGAAMCSAALGAEVVVYPDSWNPWGPAVTIISGSLADVQQEDATYMVARCMDNEHYTVGYEWDTSYAPAEVTKITVEYKAHCSRGDTPNWMIWAVRKDGAGNDQIRPSSPWATTDQWFTWETTEISKYMSAAGEMSFAWCACPQNSQTYDKYVDVVRIRLELPEPPTADFSASPTSGDAPLTVNFTDLSTENPTSWSWNFGDSGTSTAQNPSHQYTAAGTYTVSLTATNAYGSDTETKTGYVTVTESTPSEVVVYPDTWNPWGPAVTIISGSLADVQYEDAVYMVARCQDNEHYTVSYECHTSYVPADVTKITVEYKAHCSRGDTPNWMIWAVRQDGGSNVNIWPGGTWTTTDQWFTWETTEVSQYMSSTGFMSFGWCACPQNSQTYDKYVDVVRIRLELAGGTPPPAPVADFSGSPTSGNAPLTVNFTDLSTNSPTSWSWNFGDSGTSTAQNPSHQYTAEGTYTVSLTATNAGGSDTETKTGYVTVSTAPPPAPVADFSGSPTSGDAPLTVNFTDLSTNSPTSWSWNFGDSGTSTAQHPSHQYATAGTYTVSLTATNASGSDTLTRANYITVTTPPLPPVAEFSASPISGPAPLTVNFTDLSSSNPTSWSWNFGDSGTSTAQNPSHQYTSVGTYTVSLTATNSAGSDTETKTNYITVTTSEVYLYPTSWSTWNNVTLQSGSLTDVQTDNGAYMNFQCDTSDQTTSIIYVWDAAQSPAQVSKLTYEWQLKESLSDTPNVMLGVEKSGVGGFDTARGFALWPTTDTNFTWETTDISTYMAEDGRLCVDICGCPQTGSNYTTSVDLMRIKLDFHTAVPAAPSGLTATVISVSQVKLEWTDNSTNEYRFKVERKTGAGGTWGEIDQADTNAVQYHDNTVAAATTYYYRVCAYNAIGDSAWTNEAVASVPAPGPPAAPSNLTALSKSATQIDVTWADNAIDEDDFVVEVDVGNTGSFSYLATVDREYTRYSHTGLTTGQQYAYRVYARNSAGSSSYSNTAVETAHAPTLVTVSNMADLQTAIDSASPGTIIEITDGVYTLTTNGIFLNDKEDLTIRSQSRNRNAVVIKGNGIDGYPEFCFKLYGSNHITFEDMTLRDVYWHCFQLNANSSGTSGSSNCVFRNLYMWDAGEGPIKTTVPGQDGPWCDNGLVEDCVFGYTNGSTRGAIEGTDLIASANWVFRRVEVYRCYGDPWYTNSPGYGIFAKGNSLDTVIEDSYFEDCGIAISFGGGGTPDNYKRYYVLQEHTRGIMRNNVVRRTSLTIPINDCGIYMNKATDYKIYNNTFWTTSEGGGSIDIRFPESTGAVYNNLANQGLNLRDGGTAVESTNIWNCSSGLFVDQPNGNLHLRSDATSAIDQGTDTNGWVKYDMDGESRPKGSAIDIGADEF